MVLFQIARVGLMRLYDFIRDIAQTSERIAERNAHVPPEISAQVTLKTLMRNDVISFFDTLREGAFEHFPADRLLIFYLVMFGYAVNIKPRADYPAMLKFAGQLLRAIDALNVDEGQAVLCSTGSVLKPRALFNRVNKLLKVKGTSGFYCVFSAQPPSGKQIEKLISSKFCDASLLLYPARSGASAYSEQFGERIIYSGDIFKSSALGFGGVYITANV